jgi:hypothetical protein
MARPAISRVGSGGRPGLSVYTAPNFPSRKRQSTARASFAKQILPAAVPTFPWPHPILPSQASGAQNQSFRFAGIPISILQGNRPQP